MGPGGACDVKEGIEIWKMGAPPRPYQIIGIIEDDRPGAVIPMATRPAQIAAKAKERGGDGVIIAGEREKYLGSFNSSQTFGTATPTPWGATYSGSSFGTSNAITRSQSVFKVFKYVSAKPISAR